MLSNSSISSLTSELTPVKVIGDSTPRSAIWYFFCLMFSLCGVGALGPLRTSLSSELLIPQFTIELSFALLTPLFAAYSALQLSCLRQSSKNTIANSITLLPLLGWFGMIVLSFFHPAVPISWEGWRFGCEREIFLISIIPSIALLIGVRRGYPIEKKWNAMLIGIAASAAPAGLMQMTCMYQPLHTLLFHFGAVVICAAIFHRYGETFLRANPAA